MEDTGFPSSLIQIINCPQFFFTQKMVHRNTGFGWNPYRGLGSSSVSHICEKGLRSSLLICRWLTNSNQKPLNLEQTCIASDAVSMARVSPMNCSQIYELTKQRSIFIKLIYNLQINMAHSSLLSSLSQNVVCCSTPLGIKLCTSKINWSFGNRWKITSKICTKHHITAWVSEYNVKTFWSCSKLYSMAEPITSITWKNQSTNKQKKMIKYH